jgi:hypothetical protein
VMCTHLRTPCCSLYVHFPCRYTGAVLFCKRCGQFLWTETVVLLCVFYVPFYASFCGFYGAKCPCVLGPQITRLSDPVFFKEPLQRASSSSLHQASSSLSQNIPSSFRASYSEEKRKRLAWFARAPRKRRASLKNSSFLM